MSQVVVITGLGDGMGREVAKLLAKAGDSVAGFDVDGDGINSLAAELEGTVGEHLLETLDITDRPGILAFRDRVLEKYGRVDIVISNVGIGFFGPFEEVDLELAFKCMEINVVGAAAIFQSFLPAMRKAGGGKLIAMSSLVGRIPFPFESIYTATKFGLGGLLQSLRLEVAPYNIKVAMIEPAQVSTSFAAKIHKLPPEGSPYRERVKRFIDRDNELIKGAPDPLQAAEKIVKTIRKDNPPVYSQFALRDSFFLFINRMLPRRIRDSILVGFMDIKVKD